MAVDRDQVAQAVHRALLQVCGGTEDQRTEGATQELFKLAESSVSFPNNLQHPLSANEGKPHDIEVKAALAFFHQQRKRKRGDIEITVVSDLGLERTIACPFDLATLVCSVLEDICREAGLCHDVRSNASGIICIVTPERATALRDSGRLPCPQCIKWCKGEKGLWWHKQSEHASEHSVAAASAAFERQVLPIIPYILQQPRCSSIVTQTIPTQRTTDEELIYEWARQGDLESLRQEVEASQGVAHSFDRRGASALHWAAGSGHLNVVQYLIQHCACDPNLGQRGKRSFSGRTALHWAARNGHLHVVQYLVQNCNAALDASTADGTTAFGWASWQGHLKVMKFLHNQGCNVHMPNTFGCNAVLWCAQGEGVRLETIEWLKAIGCKMSIVNANGHGALHKAAQRGRGDIVEWLVTELRNEIEFAWIGPDSDGYCPSDLAGVGGHIELAEKIAKFEIDLATYLIAKVGGTDDELLPEWLTRRKYCYSHQHSLYLWEPWAGVARIQNRLLRSNDISSSSLP